MSRGGLPDGPMHDNYYMFCLGIKQPSFVVFHVFGVCQMSEKVARVEEKAMGGKKNLKHSNFGYSE